MWFSTFPDFDVKLAKVRLDRRKDRSEIRDQCTEQQDRTFWVFVLVDLARIFTSKKKFFSALKSDFRKMNFLDEYPRYRAIGEQKTENQHQRHHSSEQSNNSALSNDLQKVKNRYFAVNNDYDS